MFTEKDKIKKNWRAYERKVRQLRRRMQRLEARIICLGSSNRYKVERTLALEQLHEARYDLATAELRALRYRKMLEKPMGLVECQDKCTCRTVRDAGEAALKARKAREAREAPREVREAARELAREASREVREDWEAYLEARRNCPVHGKVVE